MVAAVMPIVAALVEECVLVCNNGEVDYVASIFAASRLVICCVLPERITEPSLNASHNNIPVV
jgi:hypothetical protein